MAVSVTLDFMKPRVTDTIMKYLYIYIYIYIPPLGQDMTQVQFLSGV